MAETQERPLLGVALVAAAVFNFALFDTATKVLSTGYEAGFLMAIRYAVNFAIMCAIMLPRYGRGAFVTHRSALVLLRALSLVAASWCMTNAVRTLPVGETAAITYLAPLAVLILAVPVLGERVGLAGWLAAGVGFAGTLLIVRPGGGLDPQGVLFALGVAAATSVYHLLSRLLARTETTEALVLHTALAGMIVFGATLPWTLPSEMPPLRDGLLIVTLGLFGALGHFLLTVAYRFAPAPFLAPVNYLHLAFATFLGWLVFGHVPDAVSAAGIVLVLLAGLSTALRPRRPALRTGPPASVDGDAPVTTDPPRPAVRR
ncbi:DMT family transporter [Pseudoroseicyclus tamaricis]|uniref:DMT family transporter n=1 Tax=Pseudoroseicyclus tamaricis TaxID=2705421 RepID=A0A6B2JYP1_9RHOB|nr:DMT family transporter [Pseudoroseicyclus tamaricis]NDV01729.1 DMT family transporter [Pseudoroseicyclus tamaricis]